MNQYYHAIMEEQIHRGNALKKRIPHPLPYSELESLAERCEKIIDEQIMTLEELQDHIIEGEEDNTRYILRLFRECVRNLEMVEAFGISALYYQSEELGYFNKLIKDIQKEIALPIKCPSVACISTSYYYYHPFTDVIFVPLAESDFLLHLPDLFHELGHAALTEREKSPHLFELNHAYKEIIDMITNYYQKMKLERIRETGPEELPYQIDIIHSHWKENWIDEFLSDLFAIYTLGPAYANAHLHLVTKTSKSIYDMPTIFRQTHPSDDSRLRILLIALNEMGYIDEAKILSSKWNQMPFFQRSSPPPNYHLAYPHELMEQIAELFLKGLIESGISINTKEKIAGLRKDSLISIFNNAWNKFWDMPLEYRTWEQETLLEIKHRYGLR